MVVGDEGLVWDTSYINSSAACFRASANCGLSVPPPEAPFNQRLS